MRRPDAGFTLIELLVALTLLALLATIVTRALGSTNLAIERGGERVDGVVAAIDLQQVLVREIGRGRPFVPDRRGRLQPVFEAEPERLRFIAVQPEGRPPPAFTLVEIAVDDTAGDQRLVLRKVPIVGEAEAAQAALDKAPATVLHEGASYRLRYFGVAKADAAPAWIDFWPKTAPDIPRGVALRIEGSDDPALPPEMIATFPVPGSAICGEDRIDCRLLSGSAL
ncbi:prepilin-type N-terminal cleavage/methylation domain-containing protein [Geminicoccus roseus]|uniref:prepilin-type N-terminal cleavage/methylation domain-containing protein n=1 Tax=Geminicoccus roseus TaxID=404900 RepID=UPI000424D2BC|nr:prepilin-type N-terminal cleavage/methylation domain-containing protein [Geminicoccus roseus]